MKVGERGQVTIPKEIRERFGIGPDTPVEFAVERGQIVLRKQARQVNWDKWRGACKKSFDQLGGVSVDEYVKDIRGH